MPKVPIDYSKTQIYKWVCNDSSVLCEYVGHTTNWDKRKASHKEKCNDEKGKKYHLKLYETMRANKGFDNWRMILIEDYPCKSRREAEKQEQYQMDLLVEKLNTNRAFQTEKGKVEYLKQYKELNRDKIAEWHKQNHIKNCEKKAEYGRQHRELNSDKIAEKAKIRYESIKEILSEKAKEKYDCPCGSTLRKSDKAQHEKSNKHQNYLKKELENSFETLEKNNSIKNDSKDL